MITPLIHPLSDLILPTFKHDHQDYCHHEFHHQDFYQCHNHQPVLLLSHQDITCSINHLHSIPLSCDSISSPSRNDILQPIRYAVVSPAHCLISLQQEFCQQAFRYVIATGICANRILMEDMFINIPAIGIIACCQRITSGM